MKTSTLRVVVLAPLAALVVGACGEEPSARTSSKVTRDELPASVYPQPVRGTGFAALCPSVRGVLRRTAGSRAEALSQLRSLGRRRGAQQAGADRSYWQQLRENRIEFDRRDVFEIESASKSPYSKLFSSACGPALVRRSWSVAVTPGASSKKAPALTKRYYMLQRAGRWLVWASYP